MGPPPPGHGSVAWQRAELRWLYRYGWPLPADWNTSPRPRQPKLNADGHHWHCVAMIIAYNLRERCRREPDLLRWGWERVDEDDAGGSRVLKRRQPDPEVWRWARRYMHRAVALEVLASERADPARRDLLLRSARNLAYDFALLHWEAEIAERQRRLAEGEADVETGKAMAQRLFLS